MIKTLLILGTSFIHASLSLNPKSFARRFTAIPCAAGSAFQAMDVLLNGLNNGSEFDWGLMFVTPSQQNSSDDDEGRSVYKCKNCRYDPRDVRVFDSAVLIRAGTH